MLNISKSEQLSDISETTKQNNENTNPITDKAFLDTLYSYQLATWELILSYLRINSINAEHDMAVPQHLDNIDTITAIMKAKDEEINALKAKADMSFKEIESLKKELNEVKSDNKSLSDSNDFLHSLLAFMKKKVTEKEKSNESSTLREN